MFIALISLITIISYSIIVSQSFMYLLALKYTQINLDAPAYITVRHLIDTAMNRNFRYVVYVTLLLNLVLVILSATAPSGLSFISATVAFICLVADTLITVKGNLPINAVINKWTADNYPQNWKEYRAAWLRYFRYRQIVNIAGFLSLLAGAVFK